MDTLSGTFLSPFGKGIYSKREELASIEANSICSNINQLHSCVVLSMYRENTIRSSLVTICGIDMNICNDICNICSISSIIHSNSAIYTGIRYYTQHDWVQISASCCMNLWIFYGNRLTLVHFA